MNAFSEDTIAAISTPVAAGGIGMVRISGPQALEVADRAFRSVSGKQVQQTEGYRGLYGRVHDGQGEIDEAVVLFTARPKAIPGKMWRKSAATAAWPGAAYAARLHRCGSAPGAGRRVYPPGLFKRQDEPDPGRSGDGPDRLPGAAERSGGVAGQGRRRLFQNPSGHRPDALHLLGAGGLGRLPGRGYRRGLGRQPARRGGGDLPPAARHPARL